MSRILSLQPDAISQLQSSKHITSLQSVVTSLVENSLDGAASKIDISLDFNRGACTVEDNGTGIPSSEFEEGAGLGKMYHTSKHVSGHDDMHGQSGTFLASLAALSLLTITSQSDDVDRSATLQMYQSKILAQHIPSLPGQELSSSIGSRGTRIIVQDLFGNMPVRVKQRSLMTDSASSHDKAWDEMKRSIVGLLLAWSRPCSIRLRDVDVRRKPLNLSAQHPAISNALTKKSLNMMTRSSVKFDLRDTLPILSQAGFSPPESRLRWISVSASTSSLSVKGLINLDPAPTKQCQFVFLGIHPCEMDSASGSFYDCINKVFFNSSFGCIDESAGLDVDDEEKDRRKRDRRYKSDGYTQKQLHSHKGVDKWPMFLLQIRFKNSQHTTAGTERITDSSLKAITKVLEITVQRWLETHHFRPQKRRKRRNEDQQGPSATSSPVQSLSVGYALAPAILGRTASSPTPKRSLTAGARPASKRRKYADLNGKSRYLDDRPATMPTRSDYFSSWSRVKSGREGFYDELWQGDKIPGPALTSIVADEVIPSLPMKTAISLPSLEVSALNKRSLFVKTVRKVGDAGQSPQDRYSAPAHISSEDFGSMDDETLELAAEAGGRLSNGCTESAPVADNVVDWVDPITKQVFQVNSRTGVVLPAAPVTRSNNTDANSGRPGSRQAAAINTTLSSKGQAITLSRRPRSATKSGDQQWLPGFLKEWDNPIFAPQVEEQIPMASVNGPGIDASEHLNKRGGHGHGLTEIGRTVMAKISKSGLRSANVIRQVDQKFILCKMGCNDGAGGDEMLVLVDQHAASERVILEDLLSDLCSPPANAVPIVSGTIARVNTQLLPKPLRFQVSSAEHQLFASHAQYFGNWGILYDLSVRLESTSASQVRPQKEEHLIIVKALPPVILERSVLLPNLVIELLRSEVHNVPAFGKTISNRAVDDGQPEWLSCIASCPKGLLEMLHSRACRSAVMFNDELSVEQCVHLMTQLSLCAFPFICAHGRVSMVPLASLENEGLGLQSSSGDIEASSDASLFSAWLESRQN